MPLLPGTTTPSRQAKLRIGLAEQSVLVALSHAVHLHRNGVKGAKDGRLAEALEAAAQAVKQAYSECPSYDMVGRGQRDGGTVLHSGRRGALQAELSHGLIRDASMNRRVLHELQRVGLPGGGRFPHLVAWVALHAACSPAA